jgi:hypothetical protein
VHDPLAPGRLTGDHADVVRPYNHNANAWAARCGSGMRPFAGKGQPAICFAKVLAHVHATPRQPAVSVMVVTMVMMMMRMMTMMAACIGIHSE